MNKRYCVNQWKSLVFKLAIFYDLLYGRNLFESIIFQHVEEILFE